MTIFKKEHKKVKFKKSLFNQNFMFLYTIQQFLLQQRCHLQHVHGSFGWCSIHLWTFDLQLKWTWFAGITLGFIQTWSSFTFTTEPAVVATLVRKYCHKSKDFIIDFTIEKKHKKKHSTNWLISTSFFLCRWMTF